MKLNTAGVIARPSNKAAQKKSHRHAAAGKVPVCHARSIRAHPVSDGGLNPHIEKSQQRKITMVAVSLLPVGAGRNPARQRKARGSASIGNKRMADHKPKQAEADPLLAWRRNWPTISGQATAPALHEKFSRASAAPLRLGIASTEQHVGRRHRHAEPQSISCKSERKYRK
jgi:hypothetical protein